MSECRRVLERLAAHVDGLLQPDEQGSLDRHLAACPQCREIADAERAGRVILRHRAGQLLSEPLPPSLRQRCEALAAGRRESLAVLATLGPWWRTHLVPVLLTVVVLVFGASALFSVATRRSDTILAAQLTVDHAKCFRLFGPPGGTSADARRIERMLLDEYGWNVHVPSSSQADDIELVGARRCLYGDGLIPHLMYRVHGQDVSLFVLEGVARNPASLVTLGHRSQIWSRGDSTFVLVAPADAGGLTTAARYVMREAR